MIDTRNPVWVCLVKGVVGQDLSHCRLLAEEHIFCGFFMLRQYKSEGQVRVPVGEEESDGD